MEGEGGCDQDRPAQGVFGVTALLCVLVVVLEDSTHKFEFRERYTPKKSVLLSVNLKTTTS